MTAQQIVKGDKYNILNYEGKKYFAFAEETSPTFFEKDGTNLVNFETIESNFTSFTSNEDATINVSDDVTIWDNQGFPYVEIIALGSVDFAGTRPVRRPNNG